MIETLKDMTAASVRTPASTPSAWKPTAHGAMYYDRSAKQAMMLETDRPLRAARGIQACRKGGTVSVPGVYGGFVDKMPMGAFMNKGLTMKTGQTHMMRYMKPLLDRVEKGEIDPSFVISHRVPIDQAPQMYKVFRDKQEHCTKVVIDPWANGAAADRGDFRVTIFIACHPERSEGPALPLRDEMAGEKQIPRRAEALLGMTKKSNGLWHA